MNHSTQAHFSQQEFSCLCGRGGGGRRRQAANRVTAAVVSLHLLSLLALRHKQLWKNALLSPCPLLPLPGARHLCFLPGFIHFCLILRLTPLLHILPTFCTKPAHPKCSITPLDACGRVSKSHKPLTAIIPPSRNRKWALGHFQGQPRPSPGMLLCMQVTKFPDAKNDCLPLLLGLFFWLGFALAFFFFFF